jgi:predicted SAM-dependent methyltransferase
MKRLFYFLRRLKPSKKYNKKITNSPLKLHLGCGTLYKENEWVNIDNNSDNNIKQLDINCNFIEGIPFDNDSVDFIYHEHLIEHLDYDEGFAFMKECLRVLKPSGVMRVACPDLDDLIESYIKDNWREKSWVKKYGFEWVPSKCYMINMCMNQSPWGHKYVYNKEDLFKRLKEAGFAQINEVKMNSSVHKDLKNIDTRDDSMIFEATK